VTESPCAFCAIVAGRIDAAIVFEDDVSIAFLDHRPLFLGHTLLVPRLHVELLPDLPAELLQPFFGAAQLLTRAVQEATAADGAFLALNHRVSQSVPHVHLHIIPRRFHDGLRGFFWPRQRYPDADQMAETARSISAAAARLRGG